MYTDIEEVCDGKVVAEEGASEVRRSSATSFTDEHCQPSVPQGSHLSPPKVDQEQLHSSSDVSRLRFSEQASDKSSQPHPLGGVGRMKVKEKLDDAVEEHGAHVGMWRGPEHRTLNTASTCEQAGVELLFRYTLCVCGVLSNLTASKTSVWFVVPKCLARGPCTPNALVSSLNFHFPTELL